MKPKYKETGAQLAATGGGGTLGLILADVVGNLNSGMSASDAIQLEHILITLAITAMGQLYRFGVKWLEARDPLPSPPVSFESRLAGPTLEDLEDIYDDDIVNPEREN